MVAVVYLMTRASAMVWDGCVALLLLLVAALGLGQRPHPEPGLRGLRHSSDCGIKGMQLLVFPRPGQTVRFKVVDEFGNQFEVHNCSVCYHWVTARPLGPSVFSADYRGCHVLEKGGRFHLRVFVEAVLRDGRVDAAGEVTLICPKPGHTWTPESHLASRTGFSLPTPHTQPLRPTQEHSFTRPTPALLPLRPGATRPTLTLPQWDILEHWGVDEPLHPGAPLTWEQCQVPSGHIPCVVRRGSKEACQKAGCCYDNSRAVPCYYGNTVQCFRNGHFVLVVSQETALAHGITLANIHVAYAPTSCSPTQDTGSFVVFQFPLTHCGTTVQVVGNQLLYENQLVSDIDVRMGPQGSITRDGAFRLHVRCTVNASDFLPLQASIFSPPSPVPVIQSGSLRFQLRIATDETFRFFYEEGDYPIVRLLREPVSVEVRLLDRTDPGLVLLLHQCWATPGVSPFQQPQWPILSEGCPFDGDSYRTRMVASDGAGLSFPSHHQRFTVTTFALLDPDSQRALRGQVYFFCHSSACSPSGLETCSTTCSSRPARQRRSYTPHGEATRPQNLVSSPGPVDFEDSSGQEPPLGPTGSPRNANQRPLLWVVLLLVAVALVLGVGVFEGLSQAKPRSSRRATEGDWAQ
uniref:Zona pellucida glycoprotein 1 n=1 Tax=Felis catus TaxID=9685 RepID=A0ABI8AM22_FELCA